MKSHLRPNRSRPAFTLIELLVVLAIVAILLGMLVLVNLRVSPAQRTAQGASQLQGWLLIAKQRAYRDRAPRGVRLIADGPNDPHPGMFTKLVYVEQPDDFTAAGGHPIETLLNPMNTPPISDIRFQLPPGVDFTEVCNNDDYLVLGNANDPNSLYRITNRTGPTANPPNTLSVYPNLQMNVYSTFPWRILRRPRDVEGEEVMKLPVDVVVDPDPFLSMAAAYPNPNARPRPPLPWPYMTIVFQPGGGVMQEPLPANSPVPPGYVYPTGKYILYVRDPSLPSPYEGESTLIVIYTRTGAIAAHPVNQADINQPWLFTQDGKSSGM